MSGYNGQGEEEPESFKAFDGKSVFTESLRRRVALAIRACLDHKFYTSPDPNLGTELYELASQNPFPSHQARVSLLMLAEKGWTIEFERSNGLIVGYDDSVGLAITNRQEGPLGDAYAKIVSASIPLDLIADGR